MDDEGYPTKQDIHYFETEQDIDALVESLLLNWWNHEANKFSDGILQLHTGGWSGNEDIVSALMRNKKFWRTLIGEKPGGHYYFEIAYHRWDDYVEEKFKTNEGVDDGKKETA